MRKMHICGLVLLLLNVAQAFAQQMADFELGTDRWVEGVSITRYVGTSTDVIIPEAINGMPVTVIGKEAFADKHLTSVVIPDSVIAIREFALIRSRLTSVIIPEGVTDIGENAFSGNFLTSIIIPNSVTNIDGNAFSTNRLTSVVIGDGLTAIHAGVFIYNQLTSIVIPPSVRAITDLAFADNPITSITIGENVMFWPEGRYISEPSMLGEPGFEEAYISGGRLAGTYTRPNPESTVWVREE